MTANYYDHLLRAYLGSKDATKIVQIGANDGRINDPIYEAVMDHRNSTEILLIEPQTEVIPFLIDNYLLHPKCTIVNAAVGPDQDFILYRLKPAFWEVLNKRHLQNAPIYRVPTGFASCMKDHVLNHIYGNLPASINVSEAIEELKLPSSSLLEIIKNYQFPINIDLLQVDCEGMDDEVLYCCNLFQTRPEIINFERCHLSVNRFNHLVSYLEKFHYSINCWSQADCLAVQQGSSHCVNL